MEERMETSLLHSITLEEKKVIWIKPGKEILINGKMFDIKNTLKSKGKITFQGLYDEEETALKMNLEKGMHQQNILQKNLLSALFSILQGAYFDKYEPASGLNTVKTKLSSEFTFNWKEPVLFIITPPPQYG